MATFLKRRMIEWAGIAITLWNPILEILISNLGPDTKYTGLGFHDLTQSLQSNPVTVISLGQDFFLPK
jgi:hypothetical protein